MRRSGPPSIIDLFVGGSDLRDCFEIVGRVVTTFGSIEELFQYLDWQLRAYALVAKMPENTPENDVQNALEPQRKTYFKKYRYLSAVLKSIEKGLTHECIKIALRGNAIAVFNEWKKLKVTAELLGRRRNAFAHAVIGMSGVSVVRSIGLFAEYETVNPLNDIKLTDDIATLYKELGGFINKLTHDLPFRDHNQVTFI